MAVTTGELQSHPVSYDSDREWYSSTGSISDAYTDADSTSYITIYLTRGSGARTYIAFNFDFSSIPENAVITSVSAQVKCSISNTQSSRVSTRTAQLYAGDTAKGSPHSLANTTTIFLLSGGTWTRAELDELKLKLIAVRGSSSTTSNYYIRFYGATVTVDYEYDDEQGGAASKVRVKTSGAWVTPTKVLVKQSGSWIEATDILVKDGGTWK